MRETLQRLNGLPLLVVGDLMLDRYHWGHAERISPEAPVPIVRVQRVETRLGGAANVAHNLAALGCRVAVCGVRGADATGEELARRLDTLGIALPGLVVDPARPTTEKVRTMAHGQQLLRSDWEDTSPVTGEAASALFAYAERAVAEHAGVIISDYGKGVVTPELARLLSRACRKAGVPLCVDPKGRDYSHYAGATCLTPNEREAAQASGVSITDEQSALQAAQQLRESLGAEAVCITRGAEGVLGLVAQGEHRHLRARAREVYDVTGAGDTFISVLGGLQAAGVPFFECMELANLAAGIVVGKLGTATVSQAEMLDYAGGARKIYSRPEIARITEDLRRQGRRVVFTNGCFDLLHAGHIQYLQASRERGDVLVIGLNSDASVRRLKGEGRPVIGAEDRAHLLAALANVDYVVVFEEDTPLELIRAVQPDVITKGADYTVETVVGHDEVGQWGGEVVLIPLAENRSTSSLIERIVSSRKS